MMITCNMIPSQNVYISEYFSDENFTESPYLYISRFNGEGDIYRTLLQFEFDLCCSNNVIPKMSTIKSAVLQLDVIKNEIPTGSTLTVSVYRVLQDFSESFVTWDTQPTFGTTPDATESLPSGSLEPLEIDVTNLVKGWHEGSIVNKGMLIAGNELENSLVGFTGTMYPNSSLWPKLVIEYVEGIQTVYSPQRIELPETGVEYSTPIYLGGTKKEVTFLIKIITAFASINSSIQISANDTDYFIAKSSFDDNSDFSMSINQTAEYARVMLSSRTGAAVVEVTPVTWEGIE